MYLEFPYGTNVSHVMMLLILFVAHSISDACFIFLIYVVLVSFNWSQFILMLKVFVMQSIFIIFTAALPPSDNKYCFGWTLIRNENFQFHLSFFSTSKFMLLVKYLLQFFSCARFSKYFFITFAFIRFIVPLKSSN